MTAANRAIILGHELRKRWHEDAACEKNSSRDHTGVPRNIIAKNRLLAAL